MQCLRREQASRFVATVANLQVWRKGRWLTTASAALRVAAYVIAFALIWEVAWAVLKPPDYLLPSLHSVLAYISEHWELLLKHARVTAYETLLGFACADRFDKTVLSH